MIDISNFTSARCKQLSKSLVIKAPIVNRFVNLKIDEYRLTISSISEKLIFFDVESLLNNNKEIDFIEFCNDHIKQLKKIIEKQLEQIQ